jgi:hypothetical protein
VLALLAALSALNGLFGAAVALGTAVLLLSIAADPAHPLALARDVWQAALPALVDLRQQGVALAERAVAELLRLLEVTP